MAGAANVRRASETTGLSPTRPVRDTSDLGDRRRWASFLTWAFVLAEMAGRDGILPASAHAGDEALGRTDHASSATAPIANNLPNISVSTATEAPEFDHLPACTDPAGLRGDAAVERARRGEDCPHRRWICTRRGRGWGWRLRPSDVCRRRFPCLRSKRWGLRGVQSIRRAARSRPQPRYERHRARPPGRSFRCPVQSAIDRQLAWEPWRHPG